MGWNHDKKWRSKILWLRSVMHTAELDSAVGCTPRSPTDLKMSVFCVFILATSFDSILSKNNCDLQYQFQINIWVWLCGGMHIAELLKNFSSLDSAVWCTLRAWLHGMMHTAESESAVGCTPFSFLKIQISWQNRYRIRKFFSLFIKGLDGFESWKKLEVKNLGIHSL